LDAGKSIQAFQVLDKVKGESKYLAYAAKIQPRTPDERNHGPSHFLAPEGSEWLAIVGLSPVESEDIYGVKFIEIPDPAAGIISAASDNKPGVQVKALLSDLKILSRDTKLPKEESSGLKFSGRPSIKNCRPISISWRDDFHPVHSPDHNFPRDGTPLPSTIPKTEPNTSRF